MNKHQTMAIKAAIKQLENHKDLQTAKLLQAVLDNDHCSMLKNKVYQGKVKPNFFETLNEALESEGLIELWPLGSNIQYGETVRHVVDDTMISVYRENVNGRYERPIHYKTN